MSLSINGNSSFFNTGTASAKGQLYLKRNEAGLATSIRNLSSGLRIHSGRDDPIGFISSSILRTEITSTRQAITNCSRANSVCSVVDSALAQISSILNDIRALTVDAANTGVNTDSTTETLQLQLDASLDSINRIAANTKFQGQFLLNGSLDFTTYGVDDDKVSGVQINQADFQGATEKDIVVKVYQNAEPAVLFYQLGALSEKATFQVGGNKGNQVYNFDKGASVEQIAQAVNMMTDSTGIAATVMSDATPGNLYASSYGKDNDVIITASKPGTAEGNYVVKFVAPPEGNEELSLNFTESTNNDPHQIEVMLATEPWTNASYHYDSELDGIANNEFDITAKVPGTDFNEVQFDFVNVHGTGEETGLEQDIMGVPKKVTIYVNYNEADPSDPANTSVNDLKSWFEADETLSTYFTVTSALHSDGTGAIVPENALTLKEAGKKGGAVTTTAEELVQFLNTSSLLQDGEGNGRITASLPAGTTGRGTVQPFQEYAFYGSAEANNELQFLAPENSPNIRFLSEAGSSLSVEYIEPNYGYSTVSVQGLSPNTNFSLKALSPGNDYDGVQVVFRDGANEAAIYDPSENAVVFTIDFSGRESDPDRAAFTMLDLQSLVENSPTVGSRFQFVPQNRIDANQPAELNSADYLGIDANVGEFSGGLIEKGTLVVHLETDANGVVLTTAADLVSYFDSPNTNEAVALLKELGISVSLVDPSNGATVNCGTDLSGLGLGALAPTYTAECEGDYSGDISFGSSKNASTEAPSMVSFAQNGIDALFQISGNKNDGSLDGVSVSVLEGTEAGVSYDAKNKRISISMNPNEPMTAMQVVEMINSDPQLRLFFTASIPESVPGTSLAPEGAAYVQIGDGGTLTVPKSSTADSGAAMLGNADEASVGLAIYSVDFGSGAFVSLETLNGTNFNTIDAYGNSSERAKGLDVLATINNILAVGDGLDAKMSTSDLNISISIDRNVGNGAVFGFRITGGGALMQIGTEANSGSQARISFPDMHVTNIGGASGFLSELQTGGGKDLLTDPKGAYRIVEESIEMVASLRGRIGSFQKDTLERSMEQLGDMAELAETARSEITDTDFALESSNLSRQQLMLEAAVSVLKQPTETKRMILSLLQQ